jgi:predicted phage-related endonuclease
VKQQIKGLEEIEETLTFEIADFISPHSVLTFGGKEIASWKAQCASRLDTTALKEAMPDVAAKFTTTSTTRVMRLKKAKSK